MRTPMEPVSTRTLVIGTQVCVPCWQTVMVVKSPLKKPPVDPRGPKPAFTITELLAAGVGAVVVLEFELFPQLDNTRTPITANTKGADVAFDRNLEFNAPPPPKYYSEQGWGRRPFPCKSACGRNL